MLVTDKGQVTIQKRIRDAAGVLPGSEVAVSLDAGKIVISKVACGRTTDRRAHLRAAASKVHKSMSAEFRQMSADDIMAFLRPPSRRERRARSTASASLAHYDGGAGVLVDSNVWIDCIDATSRSPT